MIRLEVVWPEAHRVRCNITKREGTFTFPEGTEAIANLLEPIWRKAGWKVKRSEVTV